MNATELVAQDRRQQRIITICQMVGLGLFILFILVAIPMARRVRTKWPFVTLMLYGLFFVLLVVPLLWFLFVMVGRPEPDFSLSDLPEMYQWLYGDCESLMYWPLLAGMILSQVCLLMIPVSVSCERPKPRRGIWLTAIGAAFLFSLLMVGAIYSVLSAAMGDDWFEWFGELWHLYLPLLILWVVWLVIFKLFARNSDPQSYLRRLVKWLIRGSILELLIAVPSHIIVRNKDVCCAHGFTAIGITTGLAVMLLAFGPGIYYLYAERIRGKKATAAPEKLSPETGNSLPQQ